jgi:hypothetical protein
MRYVFSHGSLCLSRGAVIYSHRVDPDLLACETLTPPDPIEPKVQFEKVRRAQSVRTFRRSARRE